MANNLWTAFIADNGSNDILVASSPDGTTWTPSVPINETSPFTPSLALFNGNLYVAFITNDVNSATGVPSNRIFLCSTKDGVSWSNATFFNQYSKFAPSLAVWDGRLYVAFVANNPSNTLLVYSSATPDEPASWSVTVPVNQTSANAPSLVAYRPSGRAAELYLAFVADNESNDIFVCSLTSGGTWSTATVTGQSCHFSPSLAVFGETLCLVFAAANGSKDLLLSSRNANGTWAGAVPMNQSTSATPCAVAFGSGLSAGFVANNSSDEVLLASTSNPSSWTGGNVDLEQQSAAGPSMAVAPFACCWQLVTFPGTLGGNSNYVFWGGLGSDNRPIAVLDLVVEIDILEAIVVSPTSGVTPTTPKPLPIGFQINGVPPKADQQPGQVTTGWSPSAGDLAIGAQQYGVKMWPDTTKLISFAEYWPPPLNVNTFNLSAPNSGTVTLPNDLTIPAGWNIRFTFTYSQSSPGMITGFDCRVTDSNGASVGPDMGINFLDPKNQLAAGGPIGLGDLSQLVAFQVVLVGFWASADATLLSGGGMITVQSSTPLTVLTGYPADAVGVETVENTNSTYGQLPSCPSISFTQPFAVS